MLFGFQAGVLEVRKEGGSTVLSGRFPYGKVAVLSDGGRTGRPRKEVIAPQAFAYRVQDPTADIHLLVGHDYNMPLASKLTNTLTLQDTAEASTFDATISPEIMQTSYARDVLAQIAAGLSIGISPGFRIPPKRAVSVAETVTEEPVEPATGMFGALIRTVLEALLFEFSIVTVPAYKDSSVEERNWEPVLTNLSKPNGRSRRLLL
jgi:Escherichia/Staphylococcus phage prohead protease